MKQVYKSRQGSGGLAYISVGSGSGVSGVLIQTNFIDTDLKDTICRAQVYSQGVTDKQS